MKLIVAALPDHAVRQAENQLVKGGFGSTRLASSGDLLEEGYTTLLIGVPGSKVDRVLNLLRQVSPGDGEAYILAAQQEEHGILQAFTSLVGTRCEGHKL